MKDTSDNSTMDMIPRRGRGRPRKYENAAERQRAYREAKKAQVIEREEVLEQIFRDFRIAANAARRDPYNGRFFEGMLKGLEGLAFSIGHQLESWDHWDAKFGAMKNND